MKLWEKINEYFGFTRTEKRVVIFLILTFFGGSIVKYIRNLPTRPPIFDYSKSDSEFAESWSNLAVKNIPVIHFNFICCADGRVLVYGDTSVHLATTTSLNKSKYQRTCIAEINLKQFSPVRKMSVQSEVSTPLSQTWSARKELTANSDG